MAIPAVPAGADARLYGYQGTHHKLLAFKVTNGRWAGSSCSLSWAGAKPRGGVGSARGGSQGTAARLVPPVGDVWGSLQAFPKHRRRTGHLEWWLCRGRWVWSGMVGLDAAGGSGGASHGGKDGERGGDGAVWGRVGRDGTGWDSAGWDKMGQEETGLGSPGMGAGRTPEPGRGVVGRG